MALGRYSPRGRWARALVAIAATIPFTPAPARADEPPAAIAWRDDYAAAFEEAKAGDRVLWLQFTGPWCPNCQRMERDSFSQPEVLQRANSNVVPVKLRSDANEELALSLGLTGLPASVIVDPSRRILAAHQGYLGPDELAGFLDGAVALHDAERAPAAAEAVALLGYCPVHLAEANQLVAGLDEFAFKHNGRVYKFADQESLDAFHRDPDRFLPANDGRCPVELLDRGAAVAGDPRWGVSYQGRLYLCASAAEQSQFVGDPGRYAAAGAGNGGAATAAAPGGEVRR